MTVAELTELVKRSAREAGFELAGIAPAADFPELAYFPEWIAQGRAAEMKYLASRNDAGVKMKPSRKLVRSVLENEPT